MKKVTKKEFYDEIYTKNLNVRPTIEGKFPYTSVFKWPSGREFGRIVNTTVPGKYEFKEEYFLNEID